MMAISGLPHGLVFTLCRMCAYDKGFLKNNYADKKLGSLKLLRWSAKDVAHWVCSIELEEYVGALETMGIHGAVMVSNTQQFGRI